MRVDEWMSVPQPPPSHPQRAPTGTSGHAAIRAAPGPISHPRLVVTYAPGVTYDIAVWKQTTVLSDSEASDEYERRCDESDERYPHLYPAIPELVRLADLLEARFLEAPWEDLRGSLDGDFLYLTIGGAEAGAEVEGYIVSVAADLGLLVYSPLSERLISREA